MPPNDRLVGVSDIARFLGVTDDQVRRLVQRGELPTFRDGRKICATKGGLDEWRERRGLGDQPQARGDGLA